MPKILSRIVAILLISCVAGSGKSAIENRNSKIDFACQALAPAPGSVPPGPASVSLDKAAAEMIRLFEQTYHIQVKSKGGGDAVNPWELPKADWLMEAIRPARVAPIVTQLAKMPVCKLIYPLLTLPKLSAHEPGGQSEGVYLGFIEGLNHPVAIKVLYPIGLSLVLEELKMAQVVDVLGIGPHFFGVHQLRDGRFAYVLEGTRGSTAQWFARSTDPSNAANSDTIEIMVRADKAGILPRSYVMTPTNRSVVIDAGNHQILNRRKYQAFIRRMNSLSPATAPATQAADSRRAA